MINKYSDNKYSASFIAWIGGKKSCRDFILPRFPTEYKIYVEVFAGAGWLFFARERPGVEEYLNDINSDLANLYYCVQNKADEFMEAMRFSVNSRELFFYAKNRLKNEKTALGNVERAKLFYELICYSFANNCKSYGGKSIGIWSRYPVIEKCCGRLQRTRLENKDFGLLIPEKARAETFFYCDPPYFETESYYNSPFTAADHQRLHDVLIKTEGMWGLSYNDCKQVRELYSEPNLYLYPFERSNNIGHVSGSESAFKEIFITNYDAEKCYKARISQPEQLNLFPV